MTPDTIPLRAFLLEVGISRSYFYKHVRHDSAAIQRYEIHEDAVSGELTLARAAVDHFRADRRGALVLERAARAARLGVYAQKGAPPPHCRGRSSEVARV